MPLVPSFLFLFLVSSLTYLSLSPREFTLTPPPSRPPWPHPDASMPPKFAQDKFERDRTRDPTIPKQPHVLSAAELPYRVNAIPPSRSAHFSKGSSATATPSASASNYSKSLSSILSPSSLSSSLPFDSSLTDSFFRYWVSCFFHKDSFFMPRDPHPFASDSFSQFSH